MQTAQRTVYLPFWLQQSIHSKQVSLEVIARNISYNIPPKMLGGYFSIQYFQLINFHFLTTVLLPLSLDTENIQFSWPWPRSNKAFSKTNNSIVKS